MTTSRNSRRTACDHAARSISAPPASPAPAFFPAISSSRPVLSSIAVAASLARCSLFSVFCSRYSRALLIFSEMQSFNHHVSRDSLKA